MSEDSMIARAVVAGVEDDRKSRDVWADAKLSDGSPRFIKRPDGTWFDLYGTGKMLTPIPLMPAEMDVCAPPEDAPVMSLHWVNRVGTASGDVSAFHCRPVVWEWRGDGRWYHDGVGDFAVCAHQAGYRYLGPAEWNHVVQLYCPETNTYRPFDQNDYRQVTDTIAHLSEVKRAYGGPPPVATEDWSLHQWSPQQLRELIPRIYMANATTPPKIIYMAPGMIDWRASAPWGSQ